MEGLQPALPPPPDERISDKGDNCRLWVGNLDTRITEFALLKLLQKYGDLKKFDFLYHKSGPDQGKPRGYCFVSYHSTAEASRAIQGLNGKLALSKKLIVRWAHADKAQDPIYVKQGEGKLSVPCTTYCKSALTKESKIRMIETKLKLMESSGNDFTLTKESGTSGGAESALDKKVVNGEKENSKSSLSKPYLRISDSQYSGKHSRTDKR